MSTDQKLQPEDIRKLRKLPPGKRLVLTLKENCERWKKDEELPLIGHAKATAMPTLMAVFMRDTGQGYIGRVCLSPVRRGVACMFTEKHSFTFKLSNALLLEIGQTARERREAEAKARKVARLLSLPPERFARLIHSDTPTGKDARALYQEMLAAAVNDPRSKDAEIVAALWPVVRQVCAEAEARRQQKDRRRTASKKGWQTRRKAPQGARQPATYAA